MSDKPRSIEEMPHPDRKALADRLVSLIDAEIPEGVVFVLLLSDSPREDQPDRNLEVMTVMTVPHEEALAMMKDVVESEESGGGVDIGEPT